MTEENFNYRTSQLMLRNQFTGPGKYQIPCIPKPALSDDDLVGLLLIGFDRLRADQQQHTDRMVHFFLYDYHFDRVWSSPDKDIEILAQYRAVLSPDFSMYREMAPVMQIYNVFRNRWCGAYWASKGIRVIPTVSWGDENTFDFCFEGITPGSAVAVSTYMVSEHGNHKDQKEFFMKGYNEMLRRINPSVVICYNTPFPEMEGPIVYVDYELSSWKFLNYQTSSACTQDDLSAFKIGGFSSETCDTMRAYQISSGMGSAYGGGWRPKKESDRRFLGEPGTTNITSNSKGEKITTNIGPDGRATDETHNSDHGNPSEHANPHIHPVNWNPDTGAPSLGQGIPLSEYNIGKGLSHLGLFINVTDNEYFKTLYEFTDALNRGGEIQFLWNGHEYSVLPINGRFVICEANLPETSCWYDDTDTLLNHEVDGEKLRSIIKRAVITSRTL